MMGDEDRSETLFHYFRLVDHVPADHILRLIDRRIDLGFLRKRLRPLYSDLGRRYVTFQMMEVAVRRIRF